MAQRNNEHLDDWNYAYLIIARNVKDSFALLGTGCGNPTFLKSRCERSEAISSSYEIATLPLVARYDMEEMSGVSQERGWLLR